jgi:hypothetical protein
MQDPVSKERIVKVVDLKNTCRHCGKDLTEDNKCGWPKEKKKPRGYSPCWDDDVFPVQRAALAHEQP